MKEDNFNLVLDLDATLVYSVMTDELGPEDDDYIDIGKDTHIKVRPGIIEFITLARDLFDDLYVYSAGQDDYVQDIIDSIFEPGTVTKYWSNLDCKFKNNNVYKCLKDKTDAVGNSLDSDRTFMIDDRKEVVKKNKFTVDCNFMNCDEFAGQEDMTTMDMIHRIEEWKLSKLKS
jgi:2-hydroxy-3-keto-5-methylthiopentenyl-1-phosphate phosphatase